MDITFNEIKDKEIINIYDGKRLGHAIDVCFDKNVGTVVGIIVPGEKRFLKKAENIFIPIANIKKIGEDVLLVKLAPEGYDNTFQPSTENKRTGEQEKLKSPRVVYARYKRVVEKEK